MTAIPLTKIISYEADVPTLMPAGVKKPTINVIAQPNNPNKQTNQEPIFPPGILNERG